MFERPTYFRDVMTAGALQSLAQDHRSEARDSGTVMIDEVEFRSPVGPFGWLVDYLFVTGYLRLLEGRSQAIKREAEAVTHRPAEPSAAADPGGR